MDGGKLIYKILVILFVFSPIIIVTLMLARVGFKIKKASKEREKRALEIIDEVIKNKSREG